MYGQMMHQPLLISSLLRHAERHHSEQWIVSRRVEGDIHRYTYKDMAARARQLAQALQRLGLTEGQRVASLAWNSYRHLELYYGASGSGLVLHTLNPRLHPDQMAWIAQDADAQVLCFDLTFLPLLEGAAHQFSHIRHFVLMSDRAHMPQQTTLPHLLCYEDLLTAESGLYDWPLLDEQAASSLCYTSGTTGNPKGVLYSHRSTVLHSLASALPDAFNLSARDAILPVVPMFHVNAWGLPYSACMVGAKLVFPGPALDGKSLYELFETEGVTMAAGVPTVWQGLLNHVQSQQLHFSTMKRTVIGGSACPPVMIHTFEEQYGVQVIHAWGMTELSPMGTVCTLKSEQQHWPIDKRRAVQNKQGRSIFGIDMKILDAEGEELPWDGVAAGELMVSGHWVVDTYINSQHSATVADRQGRQWFPTGDVATIDAQGFMNITDRSKDVIKSGGEWISSIDLENIAMSHPAVAMAACIAARHSKWDERPLLLVSLKPGAVLDKDTLLAFYTGKIAKWWTPDDVVFIDAIPLGATGKMLKHRLREQYQNHLIDQGLQ